MRYIPLALLLLATPVLAAPAEVADRLKAVTPYGEGNASVLFITAYHAALWTDAPSWSMDTPFAFTITYGMGFDTGDLVSRTLEEMKHVDAAFSDAEAQRLTPQLNTVFPPVKSGDRITAYYQPGAAVNFYRNGTLTGSIAAPGFAQDFFGIWLSPRTTDPGLRRELLKLK